MAFVRSDILTRLRGVVQQGIPIVGAGAGTGISGKCAQAGGADLIVIYNSGRFRMAGHGSLSGLMPYGDANAIVVEMGREVLPVVREIPVLAGVCGTDPFRLMPVFLADLKRQGFAGVQNFPTVGLIDGLFRQNLEETGMSYAKEVEMIALAHEMDLLTTPYVFNEADAVAMTRVGADLLVAHMGLTTKGMIGARTARTLDDCVTEIQRIHDAATSVRDDVLVICHGGPISEPKDVRRVLDRTKGIVGFFGASSMERLPTEIAITRQVARFKSLTRASGRTSRGRRSRRPSRKVTSRR
jgi:predicted TIM-barrel enzyme